MVMQRSNIQNAWANDFQAQLSQQSPFQHQHHHHRHDQHQHEQAWVQDFNRGTGFTYTFLYYLTFMTGLEWSPPIWLFL